MNKKKLRIKSNTRKEKRTRMKKFVRKKKRFETAEINKR